MKFRASNAGPVILSCQLYEKTGDKKYLDFAQKVYDYWNEHMVDEQTGQIADHITPDGKILWWKFTYNEGLMIGAASELYSITHDTKYLDRAKFIYSFVNKNETHKTSYGPVLADGSGCSGDCTEFKGPAYRYILRLFQETNDSSVSGELL